MQFSKNSFAEHDRFFRGNQEASWGGAGVKILLAVKYKRDPQGDEPGKEWAALGG